MMKISKTSITAYMKAEENEYAGKSAGKPIRTASISDTYGQGKPTRTNPIGGFMAMQCFSGSPDQKKSPTSKPGNAGKKRII